MRMSPGRIAGVDGRPGAERAGPGREGRMGAKAWDDSVPVASRDGEPSEIVFADGSSDGLAG